jgi:flagellar hook assembly protein FlgD
MEVSTDQANTDVVLTWPDLVSLPKDISLKLMDVDGSTVKYMRTTSSFRFNSGTSTTRKFKIVAESGKVGRLMITGLNVGKSKAIGGVTLSYALSTDASADVKIKSAFGKTVRNLAVGRGVTRGISNLSWNYRDDSGEPIPAGSYIVEVTATTPDGEVAKAVRPFMVAR